MDTQQNTRPVPHGCTVRLVDLAKFTDKPKSKRSKKGSQSPCLSDNIGRWMAASHLEKDLLFFSSCTLSSTQPPVTLISPRHMEATILELCHNKGFPTHRPTIRYPAKWGFQRPAIKIRRWLRHAPPAWDSRLRCSNLLLPISDPSDSALPENTKHHPPKIKVPPKKI